MAGICEALSNHGTTRRTMVSISRERMGTSLDVIEMQNLVELRASKSYVFVLQAAALGAVLATVLSAFSFVGLAALDAVTQRRAEFEAVPTLWDLSKATLLMCAITVVWFGPFGSIAGAAAAVVLHLRRRSIRSFKRLLTESAVFGLLAACVLPVYDAAIYSHKLRYQSLAPLILIVPLCIASGAAGGVLFRRHFFPANGAEMHQEE